MITDNTACCGGVVTSAKKFQFGSIGQSIQRIIRGGYTCSDLLKALKSIFLQTFPFGNLVEFGKEYTQSDSHGHDQKTCDREYRHQFYYSIAGLI
jgi:hypothetical protein